MPRALILGGTGPIGRATAKRLLQAGWKVDLTGRDPSHLPVGLTTAGATFLSSDRGESGRLAAALGGGADLLVDCLCFTGADARQLLPLLSSATSVVMISSKAVYVDAVGRHSNSDIAPNFGAPITELQPTVAPSDVDHTTRAGYGANKVAAESLLLDSGGPVTVLRPSKLHGVGAARPREWVYVKRALDRRPAVFFAGDGAGVDHPSAAANVAALIEVIAGKPGRRILNSADPDAPSALEISRTIAGQLSYSWDEVLLDAAVDPGLGHNPWDVPHPVVLDMSAASELGYRPVGTYAATVAEEVRWLVSRAASGEPGGTFDDAFFEPFFDYAAEDRYLSRSPGGRSGSPPPPTV
jgi:nucleoside-diphosphate-sugar epimerase